MGTAQKESLTEEFIKNSFWSLLLSILTKVGGFLFTLILARFLMPEGFGVYSFILAIAMIFMAFGDLGINQTLIILLSKNRDNENKSRAYLKFLQKIKLILLIIISLVFVIGAYFISATYLSDYNPLVLIILCSAYIFFFSLSGFFVSFFYIYRKIKLDFFKELIFQIVRFSIILIIFIFFSKEFYIVGVFLTLAISSAAMFVYSYFQSKKISPSLHASEHYDSIDKKRISKMLFYFMIGTLSLLLFSEVDILMIGLLIKDLIYVGYYRAYFAIILGVTGIISFSSLLLPIFSSFDSSQLKNAFNKVSRYTLMLAVPACFGLLALGSYFIKFFYGADYVPGAFILYFLSFLVISESLTGLFNTVISSRERPRFIAISLIISIAINMILAYFLITLLYPRSVVLGISGAAIATLVSRYFFMFCLWIYSRKHFKISLLVKDIIKPLISSLVMFAILLFISRNIEMNILFGVILIVIGALIYFMMMVLLKGIVAEDRMVLDIVYKKMKNVFWRK